MHSNNLAQAQKTIGTCTPTNLASDFLRSRHWFMRFRIGDVVGSYWPVEWYDNLDICAAVFLSVKVQIT